MALRRKTSGALWTVRYRGGDPFGGPIIDGLSPLEGLRILSWAKRDCLIDLFSAHDDDLMHWDPKDPEDYLKPGPIHEQIAAIKEVMSEAQLPMHMITCSLHGHPLFAAGGFTNRDPAIRLLAMKKALRCAWIGDQLGASTITYWVARDGFESPCTVNQSLKSGPYVWLKQALDRVTVGCKEFAPSIKRGTIEPKVNEPRGQMYLPLVGSAIAFIDRLDDPNFWGVNPEVPQHSAMGNQSPFLEVMQAAQVGKLTFLHIGGQIPGQFDDDFPVLVGPGKEELVNIFYYLAKVGWDGVVEYDCHPLRSDLAPSRKAGGPRSEMQEQDDADIFQRFLHHNTRSYRMIEQIIVPRIMASESLSKATDELNVSSLEEEAAANCEYLLTRLPSRENLEAIRKMGPLPIDVISQRRQNHLAVEQAFNEALLGIDGDQLTQAIWGK
jgi:xylose isomerase